MDGCMLVNESKGTVLADRIIRAGSFGRRLWGLLGRSHMPAGTAMLLVPCRQVHTFFMRFAIDVLFIDEQYRVLHMLPCMQPYRISPYLRGARAAVELATGTIAGTGTEVNDRLTIVHREVGL